MKNYMRDFLKRKGYMFSIEELQNIINEELQYDTDNIDNELIDICKNWINNNYNAQIANLSFSRVLNLLLNNKKGIVKAARMGWSDDIAFIILGDEGKDMGTSNDGRPVILDPYITAVTPDFHYRVGWVPTQADMFAKDWYVDITGGDTDDIK